MCTIRRAIGKDRVELAGVCGAGNVGTYVRKIRGHFSIAVEKGDLSDLKTND